MEISQISISRVIAAGLFVAVGVYLASIVPSVQIAWVTAILLLTIYLFAFEIVDVDVAAVTVMVLLGLTSLLAPLMGLEQGLVDNNQLFNGFASNAVISIIAVMIIGSGLDKTGIMSQVAGFILKIGGDGEARIIPLISSTVGVISSFMQNVGAAALFLPVVSRISARTGLPMSRLLMPMGFCAILGGTMTMVGSSPLILLNDLILTSNQGLPDGLRMDTFSLFSVTPIGLALVTTGILYFMIAGRFVLPAHKSENVEGTDAMDYFAQTYGLMAFELFETRVPEGSPLVGTSVADIENKYGVRIIAVDKGDGRRVGAEGVDRDLGVEAGTVLGFLSHDEFIHSFEKDNGLKVIHGLEAFAETLSSTKAGIAEIVVPPSSSLIGKTARDLWLRKRYGLSLLAVRRGEEVINCKTGGVRDVVLQAGDRGFNSKVHRS